MSANATQRHATDSSAPVITSSSSGAPYSPPHALSGIFGAGSHPPRTGSPLGSPSGRGGLRSGTGTANASPRHLSPATSQIFERDVQEPTPLTTSELGQAVPAHLQTEDHIPAVLDQSVEVITDSKVNPDDVEIVMHKDHVPAAAVAEAAVAGNMSDSGFLSAPHSEMGDASQSTFPSIAAHLAPTPEDSTNSAQVPYYGTVNPADPRRLSFISYADIIHAQHPERSDSAHHPLSQVSTPGFRTQSPARASSPQIPSSSKPFASTANLGVGSEYGTPGRRSSVASGAGAGYGRRGSVGIGGLHGGNPASANVEGGLPHGEMRGEIVVESMRNAMAHPKE